MTITIDPDKLAWFEDFDLSHGAHGSTFDGEACAMEAVSILADEGFTDAPDCASPVLRRFTITLNDRWDDERRQTLKPYLLRMIGTGGDGKDPLREQIAAEWTARRLLGPWLRLAGLDAEADALEQAAGDVAAVRRAVRAARDAAWALRMERREVIEQKVRERLAEQGKLAAAAADAAADAVAAAVAAADAVAVADAVADAVAVAAAVAAADAAADADADPWGTSYSAAYKAARAYYDANPLPIAQEIAELAATQRDSALELLDALITAEEA